MKLSQFFSQIPVKEWGISPDAEAVGVSSDSRKIKKGDLFVCLKGKVFDGNQYIPVAIENGALAVVVEQKPKENIPYILVSDTRSALPLLLAEQYDHPERSFRRILAITGTNGKTTTSFMMKAIFEKAGSKVGLIGTTKYLVGDEEYPVDQQAAFLTTPDPELMFALLHAMRQASCDTVVMEASSHSLALRKLTGISFTVGAFTNLTQDHIDFHESMEEYREAKKNLFRMAEIGVFNGDDPSFSAMTQGISSSVIRYGVHCEAEYRCTKLLSHDPCGIAYEIQTPKGNGTVSIPIPGNFTIYNSLAAIAGAMEAGVSLETCLSALQSIQGIKGRIERIPTKTPYAVFIDFAHTPDALENILSTLRTFTKNRLITLFGCGGDRDRTKRPMMGEIACKMSDYVIVTADNSRSEKVEDILKDIVAGAEGKGCEYCVIPSRAEAIAYALSLGQEGDVILLAGKGHEEYEIDQSGKHPFSERQIVLDMIGDKEK